MLETYIVFIPAIVIITYLLNKLYFNGPSCKSKNKLYGKIAIVTGANVGIGYETALDLAHRGAIVILACRDIAKAYKASTKILLATRNENVFADKLDLADLKSISSFAERFKNRFNRLDILINNAGAIILNHQKTVDGFEMNFGIMHLGHFYLTNLLLDVLKRSAPSRIINVSSMGHKGIDMKWEDLQLDTKYNSLFGYRQAKLANVLFTLELSNRLKGTNVTTVSLHPGFVRTEIFRELNRGITLKSIIFMIIAPLAWFIAKDCKQGAQTTIHCAVADDISQHSGKYFENCKVSQCSKEAQNINSAKRLWDISAKLVGLLE